MKLHCRSAMPELFHQHDGTAVSSNNQCITAPSDSREPASFEFLAPIPLAKALSKPPEPFLAERKRQKLCESTSLLPSNR